MLSHPQEPLHNQHICLSSSGIKSVSLLQPCTSIPSAQTSISCQLSPQTSAARLHKGERARSSSHLFSEMHGDLRTQGGNGSRQSFRDGQTAAAALFITARMENVDLFIFFNHSQMSEQTLKGSVIYRSGLINIHSFT